MLRYGFLSIFAFLLGLLLPSLCICFVPTVERSQTGSLSGSAQEHGKIWRESLNKQAAGRKAKVHKAIQENVSKWTLQVNASGEQAELARYFRAENYILLGQYSEALKDIESSPNLALPVKENSRSRIYAAMGRYDEALSEISKYNYPNVFRAYALMKTKRYTAAIRECNRCLRQEDMPEMSYLVKAQAEAALGNHKKAVADFGRALYASTVSEQSFAEYEAGGAYEINTELRILHNADVYYRRSLSFSALKKERQSAADLKKSLKLGYLPGSDACVEIPGLCI
ncbi:MAG: hypothetical protein K2X27_03545 [Candidatus Obscuribacterales bacterium]|nr:hypothetical protein [Candidatus Obscuribacterales bacterium]